MKRSRQSSETYALCCQISELFPHTRSTSAATFPTLQKWQAGRDMRNDAEIGLLDAAEMLSGAPYLIRLSRRSRTFHLLHSQSLRAIIYGTQVLTELSHFRVHIGFTHHHQDPICPSYVS
jgi:hypothetical protein